MSFSLRLTALSVRHKKRAFLATSIAALLAGTVLPQPVRAVSDTWTGATDANWATISNWLGGNVPGLGDTATFDGAGNAHTTITLGTISLGTLLFDTANAAAYTFGPSVGAGTINFANAGGITLNTGVTTNQLVNASVVLGTDATPGTFLFSNNGDGLLTIAGGITGATGGTKSLTVAGTGDTTLAGIIGNGTAASVALVKSGAGTLTLSAANTFTGAVAIDGGTVRATTNAGALGAGTLTLGGGELQLANNTALSFGRNTTVTANSQITSDRLDTGGGVTHTLGTLSIGAQTLTISKGANVDTGTAGVTFGSVTLTGNATFSADAGTLLTVGSITNGANSLTFDGAGEMTIAGSIGPTTTGSAGQIIKNGSGTLRFTADPNSTGLMTINAGVVEYNSTGSTDHATVINDGGTLRTLTGTIGDTQLLTINDGGVWDARASDTIGQLLGTGLVTKGTSGSITISLNSSSVATFAGTIQNGSGVIALTKTGTNAVTLTGTNTYTGTTTVNRATLNLDFSAAGAPSSNILYNGVTAGALAFNAGANTATAFLVITGESTASPTINSQAFGNLSVTGGVNTITAVSGNNNTVNVSFGTMTRSAGTILRLVAPAAGQFTTTSPNGYLGGGFLYTDGGVTTLAQAQGNVIGALATDVTYVTGANLASLGTTASSHLLIDNTSSGDVLFSGTTAVNTITASDTTAARTIASGAADTLQMGNSGAVLMTPTSMDLTIGQVGSAGAMTAGSTGAGELVFHNLTPSGSLTVNATIKNNAGGGAVAVTTNGRVTFAGANTYTGTTTITTGSLRITNGAALGSSSAGTTVLAGAALELSDGISAGDALTLSSTGISSGGGLRNVSGDNTYTGVITLGGTARINSDSGTLTIDSSVATALVGGGNSLSIGGAGNITVKDAITHGSTANPTITKDGTGTLTLEVANTFTGSGAFTISGGVVRILNGGALGGTTAITVISGGTATSRLELGAGGMTINENFQLDSRAAGNAAPHIVNTTGNNTITGTITLNTGGSEASIESQAGTLTLTGLTTSSGATANRNFTFYGAGDISISGVVAVGAGAGNLGLIKNGTGALILNNTNLNTGATVVNAGTLRLNYDTAAGGTNGSKLADGASLSLGNAAVELVAGSHTEIVSGTTLLANTGSTITRIGGTSTLRLNTITRNTGAFLKIAGNGLATTDNTNTGGILGAWATVTNGGVTEWAVNSTNGADGAITALTSFTDIARLGSVIADTPNGVVRIVEAGSTSGNITLAGATVTNIGSLKMTAAGTTAPAAAPATVDTAAKTLRLAVDGGVWLVDGANALTIGTAASSGTLTAGGADNVASSIVFINDSATNDLTVNAAIANNGTGAVSVAKDGAGRLVLNGANTFTGSVMILAGTVHVGALTGSSTTGTLGSGITVTNNGTLIFRRTNTGASDLAGAIGGTGTVSYVGDGTSATADYTVNNASTYSGGTTIDRARVSVSNAAGLGASTGAVTVLNGGSLFLSSAITVANNLTLSGNGWLESAGQLGALRLAAGSAVSGTVTLAANSRITTSSAGGGTISGAIGGAFNLEFGEGDATGTVILTGNNTYTGSTTITAGVVNIRSATALGTAAGGTTVAAGAALQIQNNITVTGETLNIAGDGAGTVGILRQVSGNNTWTGNIIVGVAGVTRVASDAGTLTISGNVALSPTAGDQFVLQGAGNGEISGDISGNSRLTKGLVGAGTWILSGDNTFKGVTTISNGTLGVSSINSVVGGTSSSSLGAPLTVANGTINIGSTTTNSNAVLLYTGAGETTDRVINLSSSGSATTSAIENNGTGALIFTSDLTATGSTGSRTLFLRGSNGGQVRGNIVQGSVPTTLTKDGIGAWILSGTNTYTGGTNVNAGSLIINGSISGAVAVNDGGTLGGSGSTGTVAINAGGTLAPGSSTAVLSTGSLSFSATTSRLSLEIGKAAEGSTALPGSDYDQVSVTGSVSLGGDLTLTLGTGIQVNDLFTVILNDGTADAVTGTFMALNGAATPLAQGDVFAIGGQVFQISYRAEGGIFDAGEGLGNNVAVLAIPEPGSLFSLLSGFAALAGLQRFRRRRPSVN